MTKIKKTSTTKFLALLLMSATAFLASTGPASASDATASPARRPVAEASSATIGPRAAGALTKQLGALEGSNREWHYEIDCRDGMGIVYVYAPYAAPYAFASFACEGTYSSSGII